MVHKLGERLSFDVLFLPQLPGVHFELDVLTADELRGNVLLPLETGERITRPILFWGRLLCAKAARSNNSEQTN